MLPGLLLRRGRQFVQLVDVELLEPIPIATLDDAHAAITLLTAISSHSLHPDDGPYLKNIDKYHLVRTAKVDFVLRADDRCYLLDETVSFDGAVATYRGPDRVLLNVSVELVVCAAFD